MNIRQKEKGDTSKGVSMCKGPGAREPMLPLQSSLECLVWYGDWERCKWAGATVQAKKELESQVRKTDPYLRRNEEPLKSWSVA